MADGHGEHPERKVHRALALTNPFQHGPDVRELQDSINKDLDRFKLRGHCSEDGDFGPHTKRLANKTAYALGLHPSGEGAAGPIFTQEEQHLIRDPSKRNEEQKERSERRVKELHAKQTQGDGVRRKIVDYALWGAAHEPSIHYAQVRPYPSNPRQLPMNTDCSGFATLAYKDAGGPDPNGDGFSGYGFTGTILDHCQHIGRAELEAGDLVVYGSPPGSHVVVYIGGDSCVSHGQEAGPFRISLAAEAAAHSGQAITYCRAL